MLSVIIDGDKRGRHTVYECSEIWYDVWKDIELIGPGDRRRIIPIPQTVSNSQEEVKTAKVYNNEGNKIAEFVVGFRKS